MSRTTKRGELYDGTVTKVDFPSKGRVTVENVANEPADPDNPFENTITVKNVLPGQKVRIQTKKNHKGKAQGTLVSVLTPSPLEDGCVACEHFGMCGGCSYQTMSYKNQLTLKESQVKELMDEVCSDYTFQSILPSPSQWAYRNKMEYSFGDEIKDGPLTLGLHKRNSFYDILSTYDCKIVHSDFEAIRLAVLDYFLDCKIPYLKKTSHEGVLRHLLLRRGEKTGELLVALVTTSQMQLDLSPLVNSLLSLSLKGSIAGILHVINDSLADVVKSDETKILYGKDYFYEEILGLSFKISTFSFFQTNSSGAEVLYSKAREFVLKDSLNSQSLASKTIFDLYSGTGTIAQILAPVAKKVIGVEIVEEAVIAARENAKRNQLTNCEFIAGDVLKVLDTIEEKPDLIVLDPPRDGIHPKALEKIIDYGVDRIVYISCKPTSLARDLAVFEARNYKAEIICPVDMFPNTVHVETVCLLTKF